MNWSILLTYKSASLVQFPGEIALQVPCFTIASFLTCGESCTGSTSGVRTREYDNSILLKRAYDI